MDKNSNYTYKNKLQEFCQKCKTDLPKYTTLNSVVVPSLTPFSLVFNSEVTISHNGQVYSASGHGIRKIDAEQKAAEALCTILHSYIKNGYIALQSHGENQITKPKAIEVFADNVKVMVLVDLENVTNGLRETFMKYDFCPQNNFVFQGFLSMGHHNVARPDRFIFPTNTITMHSINLSPISIDSTRRDACDIAMIMYATRCLLRDDPMQVPDIIVIASGDKFASALTDAINTRFVVPLSGKRVQAIHATNADEIGWRLHATFQK